jgi:hypothetical protein
MRLRRTLPISIEICSQFVRHVPYLRSMVAPEQRLGIPKCGVKSSADGEELVDRIAICSRRSLAFAPSRPLQITLLPLAACGLTRKGLHLIEHRVVICCFFSNRVPDDYYMQP